jgi:hypothetical protein
VSVRNKGTLKAFVWVWMEHYDGFPAVRVRLHAASVADLKLLITDAWRCQAPADLSSSPEGG